MPKYDEFVFRQIKTQHSSPGAVMMEHMPLLILVLRRIFVRFVTFVCTNSDALEAMLHAVTRKLYVVTPGTCGELITFSFEEITAVTIS